MTAPKKPEDHLEKAEKPKITKVDGGRTVTLRGITVTVPDDALDDFELVEEIGLVQYGTDADRVRMPLILRRLVSDDDYRKVMEGLRGPNGRVRFQTGIEFIQELFGALDPNS
ncbi:hypothetical protein ACFVU2_21080 [Leifsonia sp. NPDC058194]|uniref:hypothetical protein n=1 Tax=Leifsonia sp. NPDC058194 TaxID=3346374 RepID=UPI0036DD2787